MRLYESAASLLKTCLERIAAMGVDAIFLLGDTLDPADKKGLAWLKSLIDASKVPVHTIIGNHESYGSITVKQFHRTLGLPDDGHYIARINDVPFIMLATPGQGSLAPGSAAHKWLRTTLATCNPNENLFCCAHYSLLLHPCVQGWRNDGMQILGAGDAIMDLLKKHPNVRAWIAGHKNIPSKVERNGALHLLSPQLIQAPCGFRTIDIHEDGILSQTHPSFLPSS